MLTKPPINPIHADVPLDRLNFDFLWHASRPRFLSDVELPKVKEKAGGIFTIHPKAAHETINLFPVTKVTPNTIATMPKTKTVMKINRLVTISSFSQRVLETSAKPGGLTGKSVIAISFSLALDGSRANVNSGLADTKDQISKALRTSVNPWWCRENKQRVRFKSMESMLYGTY